MKIDREDLRKLVREALKEALGGAALPAAKAPLMPTRPAPIPDARSEPQTGFAGALRVALAKSTPARVAVQVRSSADLDRFARDIAEASSHPDLKAAIVSGKLGFELAEHIRRDPCGSDRGRKGRLDGRDLSK